MFWWLEISSNINRANKSPCVSIENALKKASLEQKHEQQSGCLNETKRKFEL